MQALQDARKAGGQFAQGGGAPGYLPQRCGFGEGGPRIALQIPADLHYPRQRSYRISHFKMRVEQYLCVCRN